MRLYKNILICIIVIVSILVFNSPRIIKFLKGLGIPREKVRLVKQFPFSKENSLHEWEEKIFKGKVVYCIEKEDHMSFVLASSNQTASALYYRIKLDMARRPVIRWKWNAKKFPIKNEPENMSDLKQDDFAARVYVIFPALFFTKSKALEYVWTENTPEGTITPSPYSKNLCLIVAECGKGEQDVWVSEDRDIYEDYVKAFGEDPKLDIGAIAFMTDSDSTSSNAESFYDEIEIGYKQDLRAQ